MSVYSQEEKNFLNSLAKFFTIDNTGVFLNGSSIITSTDLGSSLVATKTYNGGNIAAGTVNDGGFVDLDATNAAITFSINSIGNYLIVFTFGMFIQSVALNTLRTSTAFRLSDGTNVSNLKEIGGFINAVPAAGSNEIGGNISLSHVFNFNTIGAKTITLQKQNRISVNVGVRVVNADTVASEIYMYVLRLNTLD